MRGTAQRWGGVAAGLLLAGAAGCSGGGGKDDGADPFKPPPSSDATLPPPRTSFKLRGSLTGEGKTSLGLATISPDGKTGVLASNKALHFWSIAARKETRTIQV